MQFRFLLHLAGFSAAPESVSAAGILLGLALSRGSSYQITEEPSIFSTVSIRKVGEYESVLVRMQ